MDIIVRILVSILIVPVFSFGQSNSVKSKITFRVFSKPEPYAARIYITGNHPELRYWASPGVPLTEKEDGVWEKIFEFDPGTRLEYDFNLGSFESIGLDSLGIILGDSLFHAGRIDEHVHRFLDVKSDTTVTVRIPTWRTGEIRLFADTLNVGLIRLTDVQWHYHPGDTEEWADPEFDDSHWGLMYPQLFADYMPKEEWSGVGWFRLHVVIDSALFNQPLGLSIWQGGVSQIYLNGERLYIFGEEEEDWIGAPKVLTFSEKTDHVIAVRYSKPSVEELHKQGFESGFFLRLGNMNQMAENRVRYERPLITYQMVFTTLSLAIGFLHLILFLFSPKLKQNLFFALFLFSYAATIYFDYQAHLASNIEHSFSTMRIEYIVWPLFYVFQLRFIYSLFYQGIRKQIWQFGAITLAAVGLSVLAIFKPILSIGLFEIVFWVILVEISRVIITGLIQKKEGTWIIGLAYFVFLIFNAFDWIMDAGVEVPFQEMRNPYAFGIVAFFIAMSVYLSRDFARSNKKIAEQETEQKLLEAENARQSRELEEARQLQLSMLPKMLPKGLNFEIGVFMKTATEVGGDYYDFHVADDGTLTVAIGDATGHGMKAGMMVASAKSLFGTYVENVDLPLFLEKCSYSIKRMKLGNLYMALSLVRIHEKKLVFSSAGMPPLFIFRNESKSIEEIAIKGMPLGGPTAVSYRTEDTTLIPGDTVLLMSDGFPELFNEKMELLDYPKVKEIFQEIGDESPDHIIKHLDEAGEKWRGKRPPDDDITFVVIKVKDV